MTMKMNLLTSTTEKLIKFLKIVIHLPSFREKPSFCNNFVE